MGFKSKPALISYLLDMCAGGLNCPYGEFYPDKNYGSRLEKIKEPCSSAALSLARAALNAFDGVYITGCSDNGVFKIEFMINSQKTEAELKL